MIKTKKVFLFIISTSCAVFWIWDKDMLMTESRPLRKGEITSSEQSSGLIQNQNKPLKGVETSNNLVIRTFPSDKDDKVISHEIEDQSEDQENEKSDEDDFPDEGESNVGQDFFIYATQQEKENIISNFENEINHLNSELNKKRKAKEKGSLIDEDIESIEAEVENMKNKLEDLKASMGKK